MNKTTSTKAVSGFGLFLLIPLFSFSIASAHSEKPAPPSGRLELVNALENNLLSGIHQITFSGAKAGEGYFSRDGKQMIFQSDRDPSNPFYQIYLMDLANGNSRRLSPGHGKTTCSWIHPDGKRALFSSTHLDPDTKKKEELEFKSRNAPTRAKYSWNYDEYYDIFEVDLANPKKLKRLTTAKGYDAEGSYSPDGKFIAFASNRAAYTQPMSAEDKKYFEQDAAYMMDIYIMNSDGTNVRQLTTAKGYDGGPFFSADGKKITWRRFSPDGQIAEIYTMNVDGTDQKPITHLKSMSWAPYFHPSGDYLVFTTNIHGYENFELYIVDAEGKQKPVRVTIADGFDGLPVFSPDGTKLSWTKRSANGDSQIFMADWSDTEARKLLSLPPRAPALTSLSPELRDSDVHEYVSWLASAEMNGRKTGSPEEARYTEDLARLLKDFGLEPAGDSGSYLERFQFTSNVVLGQANSLQLTTGTGAGEGAAPGAQSFAVGKDWTPLSFSRSGEFKGAPVVFAGYGIVAPPNEKVPAYDSYKDLDVKGKWVVAFRDIPQNVPGPVRQHLNIYSKPQHKATVARQRGAIGLILVNGPNFPAKTNPVQLKYEGSLSESSLAIVSVTDQTAEKLLAPAGKTLKALQDELDAGKAGSGFELQGTTLDAHIDLEEQKSTGINVVATLKVPGAKRTVILGAHGDHLGLGDIGNSLQTSTETTHIHYGADDNASGVAGIMELAHYFADPKHRAGLKQNLVVAVWSGEEIGVLGSAHFTKNSLQRFLPTTAYINMDMIGRLRQNLQIQGLGSATEWKSLLEQVAAKTSVALAPQDDPYLPTDQVSFYLAGVPAISFFTGSHAEYHTPRDTPETLNYPGTVETIKIVADLTEKIASSPTPLLTYRKVEGQAKDLGGGRSFRIYLGTVPDYSQEGVKGVRLSGVAKDSPAEAAKLTGGDVIVELEGNKIENLYDYVYALQSMRPGKAIPIIVLRSGSRVELSITPKVKE